VEEHPRTPSGSMPSFRSLRALLPFSKGSPDKSYREGKGEREGSEQGEDPSHATSTPSKQQQPFTPSRLFGSVRRLSRSDRKPSSSGLSRNVSEQDLSGVIGDVDVSTSVLPSVSASSSTHASTSGPFSLQVQPPPQVSSPEDIFPVLNLNLHTNSISRPHLNSAPLSDDFDLPPVPPPKDVDIGQFFLCFAAYIVLELMLIFISFVRLLSSSSPCSICT
jgi:hypothetical protein